MSEYERVLLYCVSARGGRGRRLAEGLPVWFRDHAATMDAALAYHIRASGFDVEDSADPVAA